MEPPKKKTKTSKSEDKLESCHWIDLQGHAFSWKDYYKQTDQACQDHLPRVLAQLITSYIVVPPVQNFELKHLPGPPRADRTWISPLDGSSLVYYYNQEEQHAVVVQDPWTSPREQLVYPLDHAKIMESCCILVDEPDEEEHDVCYLWCPFSLRKLEDFLDERWRPYTKDMTDSVVCSSQGEITLFEQDNRLVALKRSPDPCVVGSLHLPRSFGSIWALACDWIEEEQRGLVVLRCRTSQMLYCWPLPNQDGDPKMRISLSLEALTLKFLGPPLVSTRDAMIYMALEHSMDSPRRYLAIPIPCVFQFQ